MATDIVFGLGPIITRSVDLVFGDEGEAAAPGAEVSFVASFPPFGGTVHFAVSVEASFVASFPEFGGEVTMRYDSNTDRPVVAATTSGWQLADPCAAVAAQAWGSALRQPAFRDTSWSVARPVHASAVIGLQAGLQMALSRDSGWKPALPMHSGPYGFSSDDGIRTIRPSVDSGWQTALSVGLATQLRTKDGLRDRRQSIDSSWQTGMHLPQQIQTGMGKGQSLQVGIDSAWQIAMRPPIGRYVPMVPPLVDPCYIPPHGLHVDLVFSDAWDGTANLVFVCERHGSSPEPEAEIVIPVRRYYVVLNEIVLRRVDGNIELLAYAFSMSIDADSWTWSFSATLRRDALTHLEPDSAGPVELEALINGVPYRLLVEKIGRDTKFPSVRIRISGRGLAASLAAPNAPTMSFGNSAPRTAQQLMADVLTINGVSIGWDVDWGLVDWLVPAGAWAMQGSYIDAIVDIAGAVGGYVQPHATAQTLRILPRYPKVPWEWNTVAPYVELPATAASVESVDWIDMPAYNGVYVGGVAKGVFGPFKRAGTAGDVLAPQVNHALITHADAHRQRGIAEISNTGRQAHYEIKTQLHPATGLILPGRFIRYVGDNTVTGIVRSTKLDWSSPSIRQTLGVETHVLA